MKVELLYFDGCPNWVVAADRLARALAASGHGDVMVQRRRVESLAEARQARFLGSPSIRVDGVDLFATGDEGVGLTCRVYSTPQGLDGSPTLVQLVEVLA